MINTSVDDVFTVITVVVFIIEQIDAQKTTGLTLLWYV